MAAGPATIQDPGATGIFPEDRSRRNAVLVWLVLALLVVAGGLLRWPGMVMRPLWIDEAAFWLSSRASLLAKLTWTHHYEHPPLAYMIEGWMFQLLGDRPEWLVRMPSFVFGLSCIPLAFLLGRAIGGDLMGLLTAALATVDPVMVEQAHQARMYSQFEALLLVTLLSAITLARRRPAGLLPWTLQGVLEAAIYWTSQAALAAWLGQLLGLLWIRLSPPSPPSSAAGRTRWGWTWAVALLLSSIGLYRLIDRMLHPILHPEDVADPAQLTMDLASTLGGVVGRLGFLLLPLAALGLWRLLRERPVAGRMLAAIAGLNLAGLLVLRMIHPLLKSRYLVALLPALWVGAAAFVLFGPLRPRLRRMLFALALLGVVVNQMRGDRLTQFLVAEDIRALPRVLAPGDAIVYMPHFNYKIGIYYGLPFLPGFAPDSSATPAQLDGRRVWVVSGTLPAERYVREARELMRDLAQRRGADASLVLRPVQRGYSGVVLFGLEGPPSAWRLQAGRWIQEPSATP